jgi:hypothetical protein
MAIQIFSFIVGLEKNTRERPEGRQCVNVLYLQLYVRSRCKLFTTHSAEKGRVSGQNQGDVTSSS